MASENEEKEAVRVAVKEILSEEDMDVVTEGMVRKKAAERAGVEVSAPWFKGFVKQLIQEFVSARQDKSKRGEEEEEKGDENAGSQESSKAMLAEGEDEIICQLSGKRNVSVQNFRGKALVSIREYYEKDGKTLPSSKGISLTIDQWEALKKELPAIRQAIESLQ
ncbi:RNA polymerase II transcriptional coactivator KELP-like isoform X1 [Selaginella moellendorffii]|uniref:RNA polymerase II transcriptional coactivator KELP-like isoform X1 n=1 Tax=Selaginella moellendorffii TaxID=88036 RepID=UPI000D1C56C5|nr:RNA polymerase II transcriptional coactivator KELP-like isoform X1 [Selaginella moellendorffii]|eukprot:XP_024516175.1 RNA polymerase II transcriptional coactivator KELP-like isoform X1 [Selaginella moellendorffii]